MASWIRFSKFTRITSAEQYFSRVWYQVSASYAKELHELYPASSTILLNEDPQEERWLVNDNPFVVEEVEEVVEEEVVETVPSAEETWDEDAALEEVVEAEDEIAEDFEAVEAEIMEEDESDEQNDEAEAGEEKSEEVEE